MKAENEHLWVEQICHICKQPRGLPGLDICSAAHDSLGVYKSTIDELTAKLQKSEQMAERLADCLTKMENGMKFMMSYRESLFQRPDVMLKIAEARSLTDFALDAFRRGK